MSFNKTKNKITRRNLNKTYLIVTLGSKSFIQLAKKKKKKKQKFTPFFLCNYVLKCFFSCTMFPATNTELMYNLHID